MYFHAAAMSLHPDFVQCHGALTGLLVSPCQRFDAHCGVDIEALTRRDQSDFAILSLY